ncbi:MAG: gamma-glutamyltransferase, partial [Acidobacteriota bacterium]
VAAAFALGSAEPAGSGLGGTTLIVLRLADGRVTAIDGSATLPRLVDRERVRQLMENNAKSNEEATYGHEFVAVPATPAVLAYAAKKYGTRPLAELLGPAIEIAEQGVTVNAGSWAAIDRYLAIIRRSEHLRFWVLNRGEEPPVIGQQICNPELARTLRTIAERGADEFYRGTIARAIEVDMIRHGGFVRRVDLALLKIRERQPLRGTYRGAEVLAFPPPGGGGMVIEALNILENFPREVLQSDGSARAQVLAEAFHIALEDHLRDVSDADEMAGPGSLLHLTKEFAAERAGLVRRGHALSSAEFPPAPLRDGFPGGTTHVAVADRWGNVVSLTQTLGRFYGAKVLTPDLGFPYNSLIEGCTLEGPDRTRPAARIPTELGPTIVTRNGEFLLALGASGSSKAPSTVTLVISNAIDRDMGLREAIEAPRVLWGLRKGVGRLTIEVRPPITASVPEDLRRRGYEDLILVQYPTTIGSLSPLGGVNAVQFDPATRTFTGASDPRRGGFALGPRL